MDRCLELVDLHVRYVPDAESIDARVGKKISQRAEANTSIDWTDLRISATNSAPTGNGPNTQINDQFIENLPSCSSESSNSLELNNRTLSEGHPLNNLQPLGDVELDKLVKANFLGLLRNKKLKKRKRKSKDKSMDAEVRVF
jgi:hypothetical protein